VKHLLPPASSSFHAVAGASMEEQQRRLGQCLLAKLASDVLSGFVQNRPLQIRSLTKVSFLPWGAQAVSGSYRSRMTMACTM
jgi:hypothetical protein